MTQQNAAAVRRLLIGSLSTGLLHVVLKVLWPGKRAVGTWDWALFGTTALVEQLLGLVLLRMARAGDDLAQPGLTQVMWDSIYLVWFVHVTTALISRKCWIFLFILPCYVAFIVYRKLLVPFVLGGHDPVASAWSAATGKHVPATPAPAAQEPEEKLSKRQQKLQKRAERGDPRVQAQQRQRF